MMVKVGEDVLSSELLWVGVGFKVATDNYPLDDELGVALLSLLGGVCVCVFWSLVFVVLTEYCRWLGSNLSQGLL